MGFYFASHETFCKYIRFCNTVYKPKLKILHQHFTASKRARTNKCYRLHSPENGNKLLKQTLDLYKTVTSLLLSTKPYFSFVKAKELSATVLNLLLLQRHLNRDLCIQTLKNSYLSLGTSSAVL